MNSNEQIVTLAHGEGARATRKFIADYVVKHFGNDVLNAMNDSAALSIASDRIAFTTDSFVVSPLFFPGGDIGSLAVYGTVNDLAMSGAVPKFLSVGLIIEEGFSLSNLDTILEHMAAAVKRCGVQITCGDTKIVPRGAADGLFINTSGVGELASPALQPESIMEGDVLIVSGPIGHHGIAVLAAREIMDLQPPPRSDCAPLAEAAQALLQAVGDDARCLRDATRGGVSAVLHEWADGSNLTMRLNESAIPVSDDVRGACELLGLDPLYIANEGTMVAAVAQSAADHAIAAFRSVAETKDATIIGQVTGKRITPVYMRTILGSERPVDEPTGAMLPRIC